MTLDSCDCADSKLCYQPAGHVAGGLGAVSDSRIRSVISKGPNCGLPSQIGFNKLGEEIAVALIWFCKRWHRRENNGCSPLDSWSLCIKFFCMGENVPFYSNNLNHLPPKPRLYFRHLGCGVRRFYGDLSATADWTGNNDGLLCQHPCVNIASTYILISNDDKLGVDEH